MTELNKGWRREIVAGSLSLARLLLLLQTAFA